MDWVLDLRTPELTALFRAFTFLGDATFFLLFIPLGYWLWRPGLFFRFGLLLLVSTLINVTLKAIFQLPRPEGVALAAASGWSFPSGHAQTAATIWPWLALTLALGPARRRLGVAAVLVAGVAASRVYLGVHYPRDVVAGIAVGLLIAAAAVHLYRRPPRRWQTLGPPAQAGAGVAAVLLWLLVLGPEADEVAASAGGALVGLWVGGLYQRHTVGFAVPTGGARRLGAAALGLAVTFALRIGLEALFAELGLAAGSADVGRYLAIGLWISWLAPRTFVTLGITGRRRDPRAFPPGGPS